MLTLDRFIILEIKCMQNIRLLFKDAIAMTIFAVQ